MMRRLFVIIGLVIAVLCIGFGFVAFRNSQPTGKFPAGFSEAEQWDIVAAARRDAIRETVREVGLGQVRLAWYCMMLASRQKVREVSNQPGGMIHVTVGVDATNGYDAIGEKYTLKKKDGHWVIVGSF